MLGKASFLLHYGLVTVLLNAVDCLFLGVAFIFQLLDQAITGKRHRIQVVFRRLGCLLVPIGFAIVRRVGCVLCAVTLILQLLNQARVRERHRAQILLCRPQSVLFRLSWPSFLLPQVLLLTQRVLPLPAVRLRFLLYWSLRCWMLLRSWCLRSCYYHCSCV